jgi:hypothetical protein
VIEPWQSGCPRCRSGRGWLLRPVGERGGVMPVEVRDDGSGMELHGTYVARICDGCGYTRFWTEQYDPGRASRHMRSCSGCGAEEGWQVDRALDRVDATHVTPLRVHFEAGSFASGDNGGRLGARICGACGLVNWFFWPDDVALHGVVASRATHACLRCNRQRVRASARDRYREGGSTRYDGSRAIAATPPGYLFGWKQRGQFVIEICPDCFDVDWYGIHRDQLQEDPDGGVTRLELDRDPETGGEGPYR